jgi:Ca2+-transporting ATPase
MQKNNFHIDGLNDTQVSSSRTKYGYNRLTYKKESGWTDAIKTLLREPMVILLLVSSSIYFISGDWGDGLFLAFAIILVAAIALYQDGRSRNAIEKLKAYSQPMCSVIRNGKTQQIAREELVVGDSMMVDEGDLIAADGSIINSNDFSVNESILTGESFPVAKDTSAKDNNIYFGTSVASGLAVAIVTAIGNETRLGKIGGSLENIAIKKTPLEKQVNDFVRKMVVAGAVVFLIVWGINYFQSGNILSSLLKALTLAMSILPEEIPVAFATFMALGAWRMMKMGIIVKQTKTVETLGSATVICTDKTGTITENRMSVASLYILGSDKISKFDNNLGDAEKQLIRMAMWASEPIPFDPMEIALHNAYVTTAPVDERPGYTIIHEYPLGGMPPMMTHIFENDKGIRIVAAKGAPEALMMISGLNKVEKNQMAEAINAFASEGYRVLAVGEAIFPGHEYPAMQQEFHFKCLGLVSFYDPPKANVQSVFQDFYSAGIVVKIVTGDNAATTRAIARQVDFRGYNQSVSGEELMQMNEQELQSEVMATNIFTRMFPDAKLKIINALKSQHQVVAMTGDGVNDGPALKAADIGIAMGRKGTEIAKQAASMILLQDDLSGMVEAVAMGRRIYTNLKKAIRYIISIHIPIILTVCTPLIMGWVYPNIFTPVHIIFLELIMGPTCSIIYENEPMETDLMKQKPRSASSSFFNGQELGVSIMQGLMITGATLFTYQYAVHHHWDEQVTRAMVFTVLISANIFLTLVNRSFTFSIFTTLRYRNPLVPLIIGLTLLLLFVLLFVPALRSFFRFGVLTIFQLLFSVGLGCLSVCWYELVKWYKRLHPLD